MPEKLRFGLLTGGTHFQVWEAQCLARILEVEGVELALLVVDARPPAKPNPWYKKWKALRHANLLLWEFYRKRFVEAVLPLRQYVDLSGTLADVPRLEVQVIHRGRYSEYFAPGDIETIRAHRLDFMIRIGFNIIRGDILQSARYGVWSFHHGDLEKYRGSPACFWEVYNADPLTGVTLQRLTDKLDSGVVLRKESFPTVLDSYPQNVERALALGIEWPADLCRRLLQSGESALNSLPSSSTAMIYRAPTTSQVSRLWLRQLWFARRDNKK